MSCPMLNVLCHVICPMSNVLSCHMNMTCRMSWLNVLCHVMNMTCPMSCPMSYVLCKMSYVKCPMSCHMNICPSIWTDNCCRDFDLTTRGLHPKCEPRPPPRSLLARKRVDTGHRFDSIQLSLWSHKQWEHSIVSLLDASPTLSGKIGWEPVLPPPSFPSPIAAVIQC